MCNVATSELQKVFRGLQFFNIFTSKMCFSPQRRAMLRHPNFKKCSQDSSSLPHVLFATAVCCDIRTSKSVPTPVFLTFSLPNLLFATAACNVATSELQKVFQVFRGLQFFNIFTSKCAFRHSGVQCCDIRPSKRAPRTTVFSPFSLPNVLFATAACNVATSELQKVF